MPEPQHKDVPAGWEVVEDFSAPSLSTSGASTLDEPALSRFGRAFVQQVNPVSIATGLYQQVAHPVESARARLAAEAAHPFEAAVSKSPIGQFGGAHAGTRISEGDVAGGLGEAAGQVTAAAAPLATHGAVSVAGRAYRAAAPEALGIVAGSDRAALIRRVVTNYRAAAPPTPDALAAQRAVMPKPPTGKAPTLTASLTNILQDLHAEATAPEPVTAAMPSAAPGGSAAADLTARSLADRPRVVVRQPVPALSSTRSRELLEKFGGRQENPTPRPSRVVEPDVDLTAQIERPAVQPASTAATPERAAERFGKIYRSEGGPVPLNRAMAAMRSASTEAKIKLTAEETRAGMDLVKQGYPAEGVMDAIAAQRALLASSSFANLPSSSDVAAAVSERNASGRWGGGPAVKIAGNPFR